MAIVIFNPTTFKARYPEFASVSDFSLQECFNDATLYLDNTDISPVYNITTRTQLLNMLTAHIAFLGGFLSLQPMARPVGRVSQAAEGSISSSFEDLTPASAAWFQQTQYGASFWQATASLRGFRYIPPTRNCYGGYRNYAYSFYR